MRKESSLPSEATAWLASHERAKPGKCSIPFKSLLPFPARSPLVDPSCLKTMDQFGGLRAPEEQPPRNINLSSNNGPPSGREGLGCQEEEAVCADM